MNAYKLIEKYGLENVKNYITKHPNSSHLIIETCAISILEIEQAIADFEMFNRFGGYNNDYEYCLCSTSFKECNDLQIAIQRIKKGLKDV